MFRVPFYRLRVPLLSDCGTFLPSLRVLLLLLHTRSNHFRIGSDSSLPLSSSPSGRFLDIFQIENTSRTTIKLSIIRDESIATIIFTLSSFFPLFEFNHSMIWDREFQSVLWCLWVSRREREGEGVGRRRSKAVRFRKGGGWVGWFSRVLVGEKSNVPPRVIKDQEGWSAALSPWDEADIDRIRRV